MPWQISIDSKPIQIVALVLENAQGEILISKRSKGQHQGNLWEFPGGKVKKNETDFIALQREIKEEINFDLKTANLINTSIHKYDNFTICIKFWHTRTHNPKIKPNENQPLKWVTKKKLKTINMPSANDKIISQLSQIGSNS